MQAGDLERSMSSRPPPHLNYLLSPRGFCIMGHEAAQDTDLNDPKQGSNLKQRSSSGNLNAGMSGNSCPSKTKMRAQSYLPIAKVRMWETLSSGAPLLPESERCFPRPSNSSMKRIQGAASRACISNIIHISIVYVRLTANPHLEVRQEMQYFLNLSSK